MDDADQLMPLADVVAVTPPIAAVVSAGDILAYSGVIWAIVAAMRGPCGRHRRGVVRPAAR